MFLALALTLTDFRCKSEPDSSILIFREFSLHFQNLSLMHFLNVIAHLVALEKTIGVVITIFYEFYLIPKASKIIRNFGFRVLMVKRGIELDYNWGATANA